MNQLRFGVFLTAEQIKAIIDLIDVAEEEEIDFPVSVQEALDAMRIQLKKILSNALKWKD